MQVHIITSVVRLADVYQQMSGGNIVPRHSEKLMELVMKVFK